MTATLERPAAVAAPVPAASPASVAGRERLLSLDVFRGLTIAGMLLVNNPGTWAAIYPPLAHATWHGWTPTDLIFPFFLFIVGITTHLSLTSRRERGATDRAIVRQILKRSAVIVLLGLLLNAFPFYTWGAVHGIADPTPWDRVADRFAHLRIPGVLQRIGVAYACAALLTMRTTVKQQLLIVAALLYGYWFAMALLPVPDSGYLGALVLHRPSMTLAAYLDRLLIGEAHLWASTRTWDPEGVLSTVPAIATAMLGVLCGRWIAAERPLSERVAALCAVGALGMTAGLMWGWSFPINKNLWTSSYVLFTAGMACVTLGTCIWLIDIQRVSRWATPFVVFGVNPIVAFVGSGVLTRLIASILKVSYEGEPTSLQAALYRSVFASWLEPRAASLGYALTYVAVSLGLMWLLYRKKLFLKV